MKNGEVGVDRLLNEQVFTAAYPLHEVRCAPRAWSEAAVIPRLKPRLMFDTMFAGRLSAADPPGQSPEFKPEADPVCLLGPVVLLETLPTSGPHQGVLWGEDRTLFCLVR